MKTLVNANKICITLQMDVCMCACVCVQVCKYV